MTKRSSSSERTTAPSGAGPLLQRDYWAVLGGTELTPPALAQMIARRFPELSPAELARFRRRDAGEPPLQVGDELDVTVRGAGSAGVRVIHRDENSITLGTLQGHPEAGRITFGAYRSDEGDLILHIRSRSRASGATRYAGYLAIGESLQTNTWTEFITRAAAAAGGHVQGFVHEERTALADEAEDAEELPTYLARGNDG